MITSVRVVLTAFATMIVAGSAAARDSAEVKPPPVPGAQEAEVIAVMVDQRTQQPAVLLQGKRDRRTLTMAIGLAEMTGIAVPLQGVIPPRPLTHDLFITMFGRLKVTLIRVVINDLRDDIYYATVHLSNGSGEMTLDSRPSDAIALAIRAKVPVLVEDRVFDKGGGGDTPSRRPHI